MDIKSHKHYENMKKWGWTEEQMIKEVTLAKMRAARTSHAYEAEKQLNPKEYEKAQLAKKLGI